MNQIIRNLNHNQLLFLDIETASGEREIPKDLIPILQWKFRDKETDKLPTKKEIEEIYKKRSALDATTGKIVTVTCGYINQGKIYLKTFSGEEKDILTGVVATLTHGTRIIVSVNGTQFDLPYMRKRCNILGIKFPEHLNDVGKKPWELDKYSLDLMVAFKGANYMNTGLAEMCWAFGVTSPKGDLQGDQVSEAYWNGGIKEIIKYNQGDVIALINLFLAVRGESSITEIVEQ